MGVEGVPLDFDSPGTIAPALAGVETVFLLSNMVLPELNVVRGQAGRRETHREAFGVGRGRGSLHLRALAPVRRAGDRGLGLGIHLSFPEDYMKGAMAAGIPEGYADALVDLVRYYRTGAASAITSTVRDVTGRDPITFEQFARDHAGALS